MQSQPLPGKPNRKRAEEQFKTTKKINPEFTTNTLARQAEAEKTGRLRALRLAKEAADKDTANRDAAGTVKLSSLSRPKATVARRSSCGSNPTDVGPNRKRTPPCSSILTSGDVTAAKVEQIIDPVMGGEEALGLAS